MELLDSDAEDRLIKPQVATVGDHLEPASDLSFPLGDAGDKHGRDDVVRVAGGEDSISCRENFRVIHFTGNAKRQRQVVESDPQGVDAGDSGDLFDVLHAASGFDLRDQQRFVVRRLNRLWDRTAAVVVVSDRECGTSTTDGRVLCGADQPAGLVLRSRTSGS